MFKFITHIMITELYASLLRIAVNSTGIMHGFAVSSNASLARLDNYVGYTP